MIIQKTSADIQRNKVEQIESCQHWFKPNICIKTYDNHTRPKSPECSQLFYQLQCKIAGLRLN